MIFLFCIIRLCAWWVLIKEPTLFGVFLVLINCHSLTSSILFSIFSWFVQKHYLIHTFAPFLVWWLIFDNILLVLSLIQLKRLELKLKQFAEVETLLMKECEQVERARQRIANERTRVASAQMGPAGGTSSMNLPGPSMVNNSSNNTQPIITGSPSQPFISGFGSNQQMHPQFMARQQMYGLGPRLPLSALHPSTSAAPNVMFNSVANAQPSSLSHPMLKNASGASSGLGWIFGKAIQYCTLLFFLWSSSYLLFHIERS